MKKLFFSAFAVLAIFGCGGENVGELPCLTCGSGSDGYGYGGYGGAYCFYYDGYDYRCEYMDVSECSTLSYNESTCGGNYPQQTYAYCYYYDYSYSGYRCEYMNTYDCRGSVYNSSNCGGNYNPNAASSSSSVSSGGRSSSSVGGGYTGSYGSVGYGGQTYKTVKIGTQTWMAENLNYAPGTGTSACYNNQTSNCSEYGRLYDWETAMAVCPSGWHLPTQAEWDVLSSYVESNSGCSSCDARLLKATSGWYNCGNGTDKYGFSALPGGDGYSGGNFDIVGSNGNWWSASEDSSDDAYRRLMYCIDERASWYNDDKSYLLSVRCLQD